MCPSVLHYFHITHPERDPTSLPEWEHFEKEIASLSLQPFDRVKVYQDTLPDVTDLGHKAVDNVYSQDIAIDYLNQFVRACHIVGKPDINWRILLDLVKKSCKLMATEDRQHINELYRLDRIQAMSNKEYEETKDLVRFLMDKQQLTAETYDLQKKRDPFIAHRINATLKDGNIGILFLGKEHVVDDKLNKDISIIHYP